MSTRRYHFNDVAMREARATSRGLGHGQPGGAWLLIWNRLVMGAIRDHVAATNRLRAVAAASGAANHDPSRAALNEGEGYYVTLICDGRVAYLAGPFDTHIEAAAREHEAYRLACEVDSWASFDAHGTAKVPSRRPGVLNSRLGI